MDDGGHLGVEKLWDGGCEKLSTGARAVVGRAAPTPAATPLSSVTRCSHGRLCRVVRASRLAREPALPSSCRCVEDEAVMCVSHTMSWAPPGRRRLTHHNDPEAGLEHDRVHREN